MIHENEYVEIVDYYDNLLTSGYYDFEYLANILYRLLGKRRKVLDIGIGTGLLTEKMLKMADYNIVGVDFSAGMLEIAKKKLSDFSVRLICQDVLEFETQENFDAIISSGGVIYVVKEEGEYRIYSHITDREKNEYLISKLYSYLGKNGLLALAIQGQHKTYKKEIKDNIFYEQRIIKKDNYIDKYYIFSDVNGKVLKEQFCRFFYFDGLQTSQILKKSGFSQKPQIFDDNFFVIYI